MQNVTFNEFIEKEKFQKLQDEFSKVSHVSVYCLDRDTNFLTNKSGDITDEQLDDPRYKNAIDTALNRVEEGALEEMAIEYVEGVDTYVAALSISVDGEVIVYWVVVDDQRRYSEQEFCEILDLLFDGSNICISANVGYYSAEVQSRRSRYAELEMSRNLKTIEATTEIVQLLDNDEEAVEVVIGKWLKILSEHLSVDSAEVFQLHPGCEIMDIVSEWRKSGQVPFFEKNKDLHTPEMFKVIKPLVISNDVSKTEFRTELEDYKLKSVIVFPIIRNENEMGMVLSLNYRALKHAWTMEEIKFTSDAVKVLQSIVTKKIQKNSLASSFQALQAVLDNVGCAIYVCRKSDNKGLFANRRLKNTFADELKNNSFIKLIDGRHENGPSDNIVEIFHGEKSKWYDLICKEISWVDGSKAIIYSLYDITDKKIYQKKIEQQAYTDFLTGLYNRMCCERDLARDIDSAKKNHTVGAIMYLDLDDFKHINDGLGHQYGDELLKSISNSLKRIVGIEKTCYRMGGDEFVLVVPPEYYKDFERITEDIKKIFQKPWFLKDADYYCTMSMGVVTYPDGGDSVQELIKKADIAMYEAKKSGKNRISFYRDGIDSASGKRLDMEKNMRDASADGYKEFEVYYQPIIDVENGKTRCSGAEALIRWNSHKLGFIPPAEFIPLAEYLGLINPIGNYVLDTACHTCKEWNDKGYPDYKVNVNLSVIQLLQTDIVEIIERTLNKSGLNPGNLTLEVTESLAINDMDRMKDILNRIKALGVKIALDDFGTGYSALNHIREIPVDIIKVDQSFVRDLAEDGYSQSFVKMIAELGEKIGVSICVEGIETVKQYKVLKDMKVKYVQGYYFDRPLKRDNFEEKYVYSIAK